MLRSCIQKNSTLYTQYVYQFHRHGEKNPEHVYPNDPYDDEKLWPGGWAQLTDVINYIYSYP